MRVKLTSWDRTGIILYGLVHSYNAIIDDDISAPVRRMFFEGMKTNKKICLLVQWEDIISWVTFGQWHILCSSFNSWWSYKFIDNIFTTLSSAYFLTACRVELKIK